VSYVDAGYASALVVLFAYASTVLLRYRRLSRLASQIRTRAEVERG